MAADPTSRRRFVALAGAGGASALGLLLGACGGSAPDTTSTPSAPSAAEFGHGDVGVLNFALTLEYLEADFYQQVADSGILPHGPALSTITAFANTERTHVKTLSAAVTRLRGTVVTAPRSDFEPILNQGPAAILKAALTLENTGAAAYLGQVGKIVDDGVLATALSIHSVEARHAAALAQLNGGSVLEAALPDGPFAKPLSRSAVLSAIEPFLA